MLRIQRYRRHVCLGALFTLFASLVPRLSAAQEGFEIEVYPYQTAGPGEWELETHVNYARLGTTGFAGAVAPTQGQVRMAAEVTRGLTSHWEVSGYLLGAHRAGVGVEFAGWRLRSRLRAPEEWGLPINIGLSMEFEAPQPAYSESPRTVELTAILEKRFGWFRFNVNPAFERDLSGPAVAQGWEVHPTARAAAAVSRVATVGIEYYGALGHVGALLPDAEQVHQFFSTLDLRLGDDVVLGVGMGVGATRAGDRLVFKWQFEMPLGGERR